jgi:hypothetical protein
MIPLHQFFDLVKAYGAATGLAEATISTRVFNDGQRIEMLRSGRDVGVRKLERAIQWLSDNWPSDAKWPRNIERPKQGAEAAR